MFAEGTAVTCPTGAPLTCADIDGVGGGAFSCTVDDNDIDAAPGDITCTGVACTATECCTVVPACTIPVIDSRLTGCTAGAQLTAEGTCTLTAAGYTTTGAGIFTCDSGQTAFSDESTLEVTGCSENYYQSSGTSATDGICTACDATHGTLATADFAGESSVCTCSSSYIGADCATPPTHCALFAVNNGVTQTGTATAISASYTFACDDGFHPSGVATCSQAGAWDSAFCVDESCVQVNVPLGCTPVPCIAPGNPYDGCNTDTLNQYEVDTAQATMVDMGHDLDGLITTLGSDCSACTPTIADVHSKMRTAVNAKAFDTVAQALAIETKYIYEDGVDQLDYLIRKSNGRRLNTLLAFFGGKLKATADITAGTEAVRVLKVAMDEAVAAAAITAETLTAAMDAAIDAIDAMTVLATSDDEVAALGVFNDAIGEAIDAYVTAYVAYVDAGVNLSEKAYCHNFEDDDDAALLFVDNNYSSDPRFALWTDGHSAHPCMDLDEAILFDACLIEGIRSACPNSCDSCLDRRGMCSDNTGGNAPADYRCSSGKALALTSGFILGATDDDCCVDSGSCDGRCTSVDQTCETTSDGYVCVCGSGYELSDGECTQCWWNEKREYPTDAACVSCNSDEWAIPGSTVCRKKTIQTLHTSCQCSSI